MGLGHVLGYGGIAELAVASLLVGLAPVLVEDRDGGGGHAHDEFFASERVRDAVIVTVHLDVIIDVHGDFFPLGKLMTVWRQGTQRRFINGVKQVPAGCLHLLQLPLVEAYQFFGNGPVELCQQEEALIS